MTESAAQAGVLIFLVGIAIGVVIGMFSQTSEIYQLKSKISRLEQSVAHKVEVKIEPLSSLSEKSMRELIRNYGEEVAEFRLEAGLPPPREILETVPVKSSVEAPPKTPGGDW